MRKFLFSLLFLAFCGFSFSISVERVIQGEIETGKIYSPMIVIENEGNHSVLVRIKDSFFLGGSGVKVSCYEVNVPAHSKKKVRYNGFFVSSPGTYKIPEGEVEFVENGVVKRVKIPSAKVKVVGRSYERKESYEIFSCNGIHYENRSINAGAEVSISFPWQGIQEPSIQEPPITREPNINPLIVGQNGGLGNSVGIPKGNGGNVGGNQEEKKWSEDNKNAAKNGNREEESEVRGKEKVNNGEKTHKKEKGAVSGSLAKENRVHFFVLLLLALFLGAVIFLTFPRKRKVSLIHAPKNFVVMGKFFAELEKCRFSELKESYERMEKIALYLVKKRFNLDGETTLQVVRKLKEMDDEDARKFACLLERSVLCRFGNKEIDKSDFAEDHLFLENKVSDLL